MDALLEPILRIWNSSIGKYVAEFRITELHHSAAFSPDGKLLATAAMCAWGNYDPIVNVWSAGTGSKAAILHSGCVGKVLFSKDGKVLLTIDENGVGRTWDTTTGRCLSTLYGNASWIWSAAFSPDAKYAATFNEDGTTIIYPWEMFAPLDDLLA
jgi:WD40 repeat protein